MNYELIREARLREPFRRIFVKTTDGRVYFVREPEHLAVAEHMVVLYDEAQDEHVMLNPEEIDSLVEGNQPTGAARDGR